MHTMFFYENAEFEDDGYFAIILPNLKAEM